mmetsp:Transcript_55132/g.118368  ORF Transcript_55132/g.118368 Transcript_55132/m.118368 type:complete len:305 (-) Transcript_55132:73-987(-)
MVLCEVAEWGGQNLLFTWIAFTIAGLFMTVGLSAVVFVKLYWNPTYEQWRYKSNPKFPHPTQVRKEVLQTLKCIGLSTICPAISVYLTAKGSSQAFCGWGGRSLSWHVCSFFAVWFIVDIFEWGYHALGHKIPALWEQHRSHHRFFNPTPFAVVADEAIDQLVRASPLLIIPLLAPTNMDMLFALFSVFFYGYGVYIHSGYEMEWPDSHHPFINTSYQHFLHHAVGGSGTPAHTGFFFKIWDQLVGADLTKKRFDEGKCSCAKCSRKRGERSHDAWLAVEKHDYSVLLKPDFWLSGPAEWDGKK